MESRTTTTNVMFAQPFALRGVEGRCPAGSYQVDMDEETIDDIPFLAWRRVGVFLHLRRNGETQVIKVDPADFDFVRTGSSAVQRQDVR